MLKENIKVKRPEKTKVIKQRDCCYVYHILESNYDKNKQYNTDKRVCIGKLITSDKNCEYMYPNDSYFKYYESVDAEPEFSDCLQIGTAIALHKILDNLGLDEILREIHAEDFTKLVDIVNYIITEETGTMQHFPSYAWNHFVLSKHVYDDSTISRLFSKGITTEQIEKFLDRWNKKRKRERMYISYDSTNINNTGKGIEYSEFGNAKDDDTKPQINFSYAVDHSDATPLFYELYPGSIIDNSQVKYMVNKGKNYGYKKVGVILDRGYFSSENIRYFDKNDIDFLLMVKMNANFIQDNLKEIKANLVLGNENFISKHQIYGKTVVGHIGTTDKKKRYIHYFYDNMKAQEERNNMLTKISELEKSLEEKLSSKIAKEEELGIYKRYFNLTFTDGYLTKYTRKNSVINDEINDYGFFAMITSENMTAQEAIDMYRKRDSIEKLFRALKTGFEYDNVKVHSSMSLESKTHIIFIASIIRNELFNNLEKIKEIDKKNYTVPAAIRELEKVTITKGSDGKYYRKYGLTKKQRLIMESVGVTDKYIDKMVAFINE